MAFEPYTRVDFGPVKAGLKTVGYTLVKAGRPIGPRVNQGIEDLGKGHYGAAITYPSHFRGQLVWDTGGPSPQTVAFQVTPEQGTVLVGTAASVKKAAPRSAPRARVPKRNGFIELRTGMTTCETPPSSPVIATIDTLPVSPRLRTVIVSGAPCPSVAWTMVDREGCPIDLTPCEVGGLVLGTLRVAPDCYNYVQSYPAASSDQVAGLMVADIDPVALGGPGIYVAEMGVFDAAGTCIAVNNQFYLVVELSLFGNFQYHGPPSIAEIRLELRDSSPLENDLLDDSVAFDNSEIAMCLRNCVDYWNESLPPVSTYSTQNFPYRYWWKQGTKSQLFRIAAEWHRKNQIAYSAGGISYDDHGQKAQQYDQAASELWAEYKQWVQQKKIAANLDAAWGEVTSDYSLITGGWGHGSSFSVPNWTYPRPILPSPPTPTAVVKPHDSDAFLYKDPLGVLDPSFGTDGWTLTSPGSLGGISHLALQPDGKILAGGIINTGVAMFTIARYNSDGSFDTTFGTDGFSPITLGTNDGAHPVCLQPDGKILAGGYATVGGQFVFALVRCHADGSLDTSFGTGGSNLTTPGTSDTIRGMALQPDGKIVVSGYAKIGGDTLFALARYNSDGSLDTSFGTNGFNVDDPLGTNDWFTDIALQPDGKIVAGGRVTMSGLTGFVVARYNSDGSLDTSFGTDGFNTTTPGAADYINSIALQPDGKIVVGGGVRVGGKDGFGIARYNSDGSLDTSFGTDGYNFATVGDIAAIISLAQQPNGKILAGGYTSTTVYGFAVVCYNSDGSLDTNFGTDGFNTDTPPPSAICSAVALQPDGKLLAGGTTQFSYFALGRYK